MRVRLAAAVTLLLTAISSAPASAQDADADADRATRRALFDRIAWADGPVKGQLGTVAEVSVPESCRFTGAEGTKLFMELTENPTSGNEEGILLCENAREDGHPWFVVFSYDASGYVKDDEKSELDSASILETLQEGAEAGNEERRKRGWGEIEITGWARAPFYDPETNNLTWSTRLRGKGETDETINHSVRLLGRGGVMHADLVIDPTDLATAVPAFDDVVAEYRYLAGSTYGEWREGDKVAEYGLTALIAGGAGATAVKLGLFGKMWKFVLGILLVAKKFIIVVALGAFGFLKKLFTKKKSQTATPGTTKPPGA